MLGGWGMLIWVQGEGARVGEAPPACLTAPPVRGPQRQRGCGNLPSSCGAGGSALAAAAGGEVSRWLYYSAALQERTGIHKSHHLAGNSWERLGTAGAEGSPRDLCRAPPPPPASRPLPQPRSRSLFQEGEKWAFKSGQGAGPCCTAAAESTLPCSSWPLAWRPDAKGINQKPC